MAELQGSWIAEVEKKNKKERQKNVEWIKRRERAKEEELDKFMS